MPELTPELDTRIPDFEVLPNTFYQEWTVTDYGEWQAGRTSLIKVDPIKEWVEKWVKENKSD